MAFGGRAFGLDMPATDFPKRIYESLRGYLDKDDAIAHRDWRLLISVLGLSQEDRKIVEQSDKKTEVALGLWQQRVGADVATGHALVGKLRDMGRFDAAKEVERFLGSRLVMVSQQIKRAFDEIDEAAKMGDIEALKTLIGDKTGRELDEKFKDMFRSPLHSAAYYGHLPAVKFLVEKGFDIRRLDQDGNTPRYWADDEDIVAFLDKIASSLAMDTSMSGPVARSELDEATFEGDLKRMEELLKEGSDVNQSCPPGHINIWTPLHTAARRGDLNAVKLLVEHGASIEKEWEELTAEDYARKLEFAEISEYLERKRKKLEKDVEKVSQVQLEKLLGQTITVILQGDEDMKKSPYEFQIQSLTLADIMKGISDLMRVEIRSLKTKEHGTIIIQTRDLLFARDLIACTVEQVPSAIRKHVDREVTSEKGSQRFVVSIQHFSTYWSRPAEEFEFGLNDDYNAILAGISGRLGLPVHCLYTSDKLSKIKQAGVLSTKSRVIAAAEHDRVKEESGALVNPKFFGAAQSKVFSSDGGALFDFEHGVLLEIPKGAIGKGRNVRVAVQVAAPDKRMDLSSNWGRVYPIGLPVFVDTDPRGYGFLQPVKLRVPHCGVFEPNWQPRNIVVLSAGAYLPLRSQMVFERLPEDQFEVTDSHVIIQSFKFSWFWVFTESTVLSRQCTVALYTLSDEAARQVRDTLHVTMAVFPNLHLYYSAANEAIANADVAPGGRDAGPYVLRAKAPFLVTSQSNIDVEIQNRGSVDWKIRPASLRLAFDDVWNILYTGRRLVYEVDICLRWLLDASQKNDTPILLEFCLSDGGVTSRSKKLNCFINLPESQTPTPNVIPPAAEEELARLFDSIGGEENDRGWYALGVELGMTRDQLEKLKREPHPTSLILRKFMCRHGEMKELSDALRHLGYQLPS